MPYDICEDESSLDCIEGEMAARGITQRLIDNTRASTERQMLRDLKNLAAASGELEYRDHQGATPVRQNFHKIFVLQCKKLTMLVVDGFYKLVLRRKKIKPTVKLTSGAGILRIRLA